MEDRMGWSHYLSLLLLLKSITEMKFFFENKINVLFILLIKELMLKKNQWLEQIKKHQFYFRIQIGLFPL